MIMIMVVIGFEAFITLILKMMIIIIMNTVSWVSVTG